ncbi:MAG: RDD family protein [Gammaproteobacteria bacterium]|nr:RDD family protein [Gammaproteobacteria bacterium]
MDAEGRQRLAELPPAGLLRRLGALVYDGLLVLALILTTAGVANLFAARPDIPDDAASVSLENMQIVSGPLLGSVIVIVVFSFFAYFWVRHGRTLGMQAWRLRVQTQDGCNISLTQALIRFLAAIPSLALLGIGYFWMLLDPNFATWPDRLSRTRVVTLPPDLDAQN